MCVVQIKKTGKTKTKGEKKREKHAKKGEKMREKRRQKRRSVPRERSSDCEAPHTTCASQTKPSQPKNEPFQNPIRPG